MRLLGSMLAIGTCISAAAYARTDAGARTSSLQHGSYVAPFLSYAKADDRWQSDAGFGGGLALGYRWQRWALEFTGSYAQYGADAGSDDTKLLTYGLNALSFPFDAAPHLYATLGGGYLGASDRAETTTRQVSLGPGMIVTFADTASEDLSAYYVQGGTGYLFGLRAGQYEMAIRAELLLRYADGDSQHFTDYLAQLAVQLPFGKTAPPARSEAPVKVVPVQDSTR